MHNGVFLDAFAFEVLNEIYLTYAPSFLDLLTSTPPTHPLNATRSIYTATTYG